MKLKAKELRIFYSGSINTKLDNQLENALKKHGYRRWASGYTFEDDVRDLAFDKKTMEDIP